MTGKIKECNWKKELDTCQVPWAGFWFPMEKENSEQNRIRGKDDEFHVGCKECEAYGAGEAFR